MNTDTYNYLIMILSPLFFLISKLSLQYSILYDNLRKKHSKTYIRKSKGNLFKSFFLINFKKDIKIGLYLSNIIIGVLFILSVFISIIYLFLWIVDYDLQSYIIPNLTIRIILVLAFLRVIRLIYDKTFHK